MLLGLLLAGVWKAANSEAAFIFSLSIRVLVRMTVDIGLCFSAITVSTVPINAFYGMFGDWTR